MEGNINKTDVELIDLMISSKTIQEWNSNRESIKAFRDNQWIGKNIDAGNLIAKTTIE